jgi:hypothetical protein
MADRHPASGRAGADSDHDLIGGIDARRAIASIDGGLILATLVLVIVMDWLIGLTKRMSV